MVSNKIRLKVVAEDGTDLGFNVAIAQIYGLKGMEFPKNCRECRLHRNSVCIVTGEKVDKFVWTNTKDPKCPVVEVER